jgi:hypothetical protein
MAPNLSLFLGRNEMNWGGGGIKIGRYSGELLKKVFLINSLNFDSRTLLRNLLEMLSVWVRPSGSFRKQTPPPSLHTIRV